MLFMKVWGVGFFACGLSFWFLYLSQPPGDFPEAAYFFLLPVLIWFNFKPKSKVGANHGVHFRIHLPYRVNWLDQACNFAWNDLIIHYYHILPSTLGISWVLDGFHGMQMLALLQDFLSSLLYLPFGSS
jgi:hypothetical protein